MRFGIGNCSAVNTPLYTTMLKCILVSKYNNPVHIFFLQALFTLPLSVLKKFPGGKEQQHGVFLLRIYYTQL